MKTSRDWNTEAAVNLSNGMSREETIDFLTRNGLAKSKATHITNELIQESRSKSQNTILYGMIVLFLVMVLIGFVGFNKIFLLGGLLALGLIVDGIRKLGMLWLLS